MSVPACLQSVQLSVVTLLDDVRERPGRHVQLCGCRQEAPCDALTPTCRSASEERWIYGNSGERREGFVERVVEMVDVCFTVNRLKNEAFSVA